jgi:prolyl oligopeptidase
MQERVKELNKYDKYSSPSRKGPYYFFFKTAGLQNQGVLYIQKGLDAQPEVLIDPNAWGETTRLGAFSPSDDAKYAVYGVQENGADWTTSKVIELATKKTLPNPSSVSHRSPATTPTPTRRSRRSTRARTARRFLSSSSTRRG